LRKRGALLILLLVLLAFSVSAYASNEIPFHLGTYGTPTPADGRPWNLSELAAMGFDAFYRPADWTYELSHPGWFEEVAGGESLTASKLGMTYIVDQRYICPIWNYIDLNYSHWASKSGIVEPYVPSCVDEPWWKYIFEDPAVFLANLSLYYPFWGIVWDMEISGYTPNLPEEYTYDLAALQAFGRDTGRTIPSLEPNGGYLWLKGTGLLTDYQNWMDQKVFHLAKNVKEKVHAINPNLSLGLLYFDVPHVTPNYYWKILEGFNSSQAPVTAWGEDTYGGYLLGGSKGVDTYRRLFREHRLNGMFLPGIGYPGPPNWNQLIAVEEALRDNGHLWLFQWGYPKKYDQDYRRNFRYIHSYLLFNRTNPNPLPSFDIFPSVEARPYLGPKNVTSLLLRELPPASCRTCPYSFSPLPPDRNFTFVTDSQRVLYVGHNYTARTLKGPNPSLRLADLPCIIYGLDRDDLLPSQALSLIGEFEELIGLCEEVGVGEPVLMRSRLEGALKAFGDGEFEGAVSALLGIRGHTYHAAMSDLWPRVQAGLASPRNSEVPMNVLRTLSNAKNFFDRGAERDGELYLLEGLNQWAQEVEEDPTLMGMVVLFLLLAASRRLWGVTAGALPLHGLREAEASRSNRPPLATDI